MSYITRTSNIVMVDQTCLSEALQRLQATNVRMQNRVVNFSHEGQHFTFTRLTNGTYSWRGEQSHSGRIDQMFRSLERAYSEIQQERIEAERREKERIAMLQQRLADLDASTSFGDVKHQEAEFNKADIEKELAASKASLAVLEEKQTEFEKSRQHYLTTTKEQVEAVGKKGNWGLANLTEDRSGRKTHIQFRRKVSN